MVSYDLNMSLFFLGCEHGIDAHITNTQEWLPVSFDGGDSSSQMVDRVILCKTSHDLEELRIGQFPNHFKKKIFESTMDHDDNACDSLALVFTHDISYKIDWSPAKGLL